MYRDMAVMILSGIGPAQPQSNYIQCLCIIYCKRRFVENAVKHIDLIDVLRCQIPFSFISGMRKLVECMVSVVYIGMITSNDCSRNYVLATN